jgi:hypothetical protein
MHGWQCSGLHWVRHLVEAWAGKCSRNQGIADTRQRAVHVQGQHTMLLRLLLEVGAAGVMKLHSTQVQCLQTS